MYIKVIFRFLLVKFIIYFYLYFLYYILLKIVDLYNYVILFKYFIKIYEL